MTGKILGSVRYVLVFSVLLFGIISCEKDFEDIGVNLVDNNLFNTKDTIFEVLANTRNVDSSRVDLLPRYTLGVYRDADFGKLESTIVSQIGLPFSLDFGLNPEIDTVIFEIPYFAVNDEPLEDGKPQFILDSIYGDLETPFELKVSQLKTFLNTLDPSDPTKLKSYYSDEEYIAETELGLIQEFVPNAEDTVLYVTRKLLDDIDTIKREPLLPSLKVPLDNDKIKAIFLDNASGTEFESDENFVNYFRGLLVEATEISGGGSMMTLDLTQAGFTIYYTNEILTDEQDVDLNNDGDTDDLQVPVKTRQQVFFAFSNQRAASYKRDYTGSMVEAEFSTPDLTQGKEKLYVQANGGSEIVLDLFSGLTTEQLDQFRSQNWLINSAFLELYIDDDFDNEDIPNRLYMYNAENNSILLDVVSEARTFGIDGNIDRDDDGNPTKYQFLITDYISEILKADNTLELSKLAIKTFHPTDNIISAIDTIVKDFSWNPRGIVLKGNNLPLTDPERLQLKIYYTEDPE